jgi:hypothetical protein
MDITGKRGETTATMMMIVEDTDLPGTTGMKFEAGTAKITDIFPRD